MDSDAAAAQLDAVENDIVSLCPDCARIGIDQVPVLIHGHREGMVHRYKSLFLVAPLKQREFNDPQEIELIMVNKAQFLAEFESEGAQHVPYDLVLVRRDEQKVALLSAHSLDDRLDLIFSHEFGKRALDASVFLELNIRKALGAVTLGESDQSIDLLSGHAALPLDIDAAHGAALHSSCVCKYGKAAVLYNIRDIGQLHIEAGIGLVRAVVVHGVDPLHSGKGKLDVDAECLLSYILDQSLIDINDVVYVDKGQFHIGLRELRLSVSAQVLVAEALGDLEISVKARAHQKLLEQLGRLGQSIEIAGVHAAGYQIVSGAFGRGLAKDGGLNLKEALSRHKLSHVLDHLASEDQSSLHIGTAKVQASVLEAQVLLGIAVLHDVEGRRLGFGEDPGLFDSDLDGACCQIRINSLSLAYSSGGCNYEFRSHLLSLGKILRAAVCLLIDQLQDTASVAQVHKDQSAFISLLGHPSHNGDGLANVRFAKFRTPACAL